MNIVDGVMQAEIDGFLAERRHAIVATNQPDRPPQLSPVWYVWEDGVIYISTSSQSLKAQNIQRDSRMSLCVDGGWGDFRYVALSGDASLIPYGTDLQQSMRWQIIRKYHDSDDSARAYFESNVDEETVIIMLRPSRIVYRNFNS
jgi:PPOX class probable F420-dependent enzyme